MNALKGSRGYDLGALEESTRSVPVMASTTNAVTAADGVPEVLSGNWNLERFSKNPVVLWGHDAKSMPIGTAHDIESGPDGLKMRVKFASEKANPMAEQVFQATREGIVRGISVGWGGGNVSYEDRGGVRTRIVDQPELNEVSFVPVPADEDGLVGGGADDDDVTPAIAARAHETESCRGCKTRSKLRADYPWSDCMSDQMKKYGSEETAAKVCGAIKAESEGRNRDLIISAARMLRSARKTTPAERTDANDAELESRFDFLGSVSEFERTQVGGIRVKARISKIGVLQYRKPDGSIRRELRLPEEVFKADSLATLNGATVTDIHHHVGMLDTSNWKNATLGHTEQVRQDGDFISAELVINDPGTVAAIENRQLHDISAGYRCKLEHTPGTWKGQPYDAIQRGIRYNHVAVLRKGQGRAGTDVALRLDARDAYCVEAPAAGDIIMTDPVRVIRLDGKNINFGSEEHLEHLEKGHAATVASFNAKVTELTSRCDKAEADRDVARTDAKKSLEDLKEEKDGEKTKARRRSRNKLLRRAIRLMASDDDDEDEDKMDALEDSLDLLTDRQLQEKVIRTDAKYTDGLAGDGTPLDKKSDDYIAAIFDSVCKAGVTRSDGIDSVVNTLRHVQRVDAIDKDDKLVLDARAAMHKNLHEAWRTPKTA
jgi:HK97 family phage prohead protease